MLTKLIGSACIFCGSLWFGFYKSNILRRREKYLSQVITFLKLLEVEIHFSAARLGEVFSRISERVYLGGLLELAAERFASDGIRAAWEYAVEEKCVYLTADDKAALKMLGAELGMTDRENQIKNIQHIAKLTEKQHSDAHEERVRLSRLYEGGGALLGLLIIVLLI